MGIGMSIAVQVLPTLNVVAIHVDGDTVFIRRDKVTEFLAAFMRAMADSIPAEEQMHSVHADRYAEFERRAEARRLFLCDPDESCRDGAPTDDEIYSPAYVGEEGPTKAA